MIYRLSLIVPLIKRRNNQKIKKYFGFFELNILLDL